MKRKSKNVTPQEWLDIGYNPNRRKKWQEQLVAQQKACPECGERRKIKIVHLRPGFKYCETCKTEYLVTELLRLDEEDGIK